tara:strand:- start:2908 stop:3078 length:171 start_codon:yes stop_codon:yes gene_type:complete
MMSNLFTDWAVDQAIDRAMEKVEDLQAQGKILNDDEVDALTNKEFDEVMKEVHDAS